MSISISGILEMAHSPISNYIIPGLTSWLIGQPSENGFTRLFHMDRHQHEFVTPHNHRFNFNSIVLRGAVKNITFKPNLHNGDRYQICNLTKSNHGFGEYFLEETKQTNFFQGLERDYIEGESYYMDYKDFHSIKFEKNTYLLIMEGPKKTKTTSILQPVVGGKIVNTFTVAPWMFQRG